MNVSILILTLNEEANLSECLQSVKWSDDIVVLDSFSSDRHGEDCRGNGRAGCPAPLRQLVCPSELGA